MQSEPIILIIETKAAMNSTAQYFIKLRFLTLQLPTIKINIVQIFVNFFYKFRTCILQLEQKEGRLRQLAHACWEVQLYG